MLCRGTQQRIFARQSATRAIRIMPFCATSAARPIRASGKSIAPLSGLRGLAVLYVLMSHLGLSGLYLLPLPHDSIGKVGVWIFFTLSAFLLTSHLVVDIESSESRGLALLQYWVRRVFRIFPLYGLTLFLYWVSGEYSMETVVGHLLLIDGREHFWAIPVEFQYYLIIPILALLAVSCSPSVLITILLALTAHAVLSGVADPEMVFASSLGIGPKLLPFLLGSILALSVSTFPPKSTRSGAQGPDLISIACFLTLLLSTCLYRGLRAGDLAVGWSILVSLSIGGSVVGMVWSSLHPARLAARCLGTRPLVFLGEISFSLYLLHWPIIKLVKNLVLAPPCLAAWLSLVFSVGVAAFSYRLIEVPGIRWGTCICRHLAARTARGPSRLVSDLRCITKSSTRRSANDGSGSGV